MFSSLRIGVLALQGDYERHLFRLSQLNVETREVRTVEQLERLDGLIIPGGESSTFSELIDRFELRDKLTQFCSKNAVWGTCAGMIMLAREANDKRIKPMGIIDIDVIRNGYGRQIYSRYAEITAQLNGVKTTLPVSFIRAPLVNRHGSQVRVIAQYQKRPILLSQDRCLVSSFHTELQEDDTLLKYFLKSFVMNGER